MPGILVTGFEPFGGQKKNASWEAVQRLPEAIGGCPVHKLMVPVVFGKAGQTVLEAVRSLRPDFVFMAGEAGGRKDITPESTAVNERVGRIPDNAGFTPEPGAPIVPGGSLHLHPTLPHEQVINEMSSRGEPIKLSDDAGRYVCNDLFYTMLYASRASGLPVFFIHVPYCEKQGDLPFLPAEQTSNVLARYIEGVISLTQKTAE